MKTKYQSYQWNKSLQEKIKKAESFHISWHILFSILIILAVSFGLRILEHNFFSVNQENQPEPWNIQVVSAATLSHQAELTEQSHGFVNIMPNGGFTFILKYENTGESTWTRENVYLKSLTTALKFRHEFWPDPFLPAQLEEEIVEPGEIGTFKFALTAPGNYNEYNGDFLLVNDNILIKGGNVSLTMNVVKDPAAAAEQQKKQASNQISQNNLTIKNVCTLSLNPEILSVASALSGNEALDNVSCVEKFSLPEKGPDIRVGLFHSEDPITIKNDHAWQVYDKNDKLLASVPKDVELTFHYLEEKTEYVFDFIDRTVRTDSYLKFNNFNDGMFTVTSYEDRPSWNTSINYNDFIGDLEMRHNDSKDRTWLIEILPLEDYVAGIKETSNYDPAEYLKTMAVAARTYAMYHHNKGTKHANEYFDVDSYYDQVYKGYVASLVLPNHAQAVADTRGIVATYDDNLIVAAYFSRSDGRTRSFKEVWYNDVPYLISVPTPYTADMELWGHGVGIDATDARAHAKHEDWTYDQLLKYYYTGIDLEQIY